VRDAGTFVRATVSLPGHAFELDLVHEALPDLEPPPPAIEGVVVESFVDLRAAKLTCLLSRAEPRDLVDIMFLDRAGHAPEADLPLALRKDAGIDPGVLAWLLRDFPTSPLPNMLVPLSKEGLTRFRDELAERFRRIALP
jgi:Nucleotidyl transferase AbiEii toxin, Type IV TA system